MPTTASQKPLKRDQNLVPLSRQHHFGLLFCWKLRQGLQLPAPLQVMQQYVQLFWQQHLAPHLAAEEDLIARTLKSHDVMRQTIEEEHRLLEWMATEIGAAAEVQPSAFRELADFLSQHIRFEERTFFQYLENRLSAEELAEIGAQLQPLETPSEDAFLPAFWLPAPAAAAAPAAFVAEAQLD